MSKMQPTASASSLPGENLNALMLTVPSKKSQDVDFSLRFKHYLDHTSITSDSKKICKDNLARLNDVRRNALFNAPGNTQLLKEYYDQLGPLDDKFPINEQAVIISFSWYDAFGMRPNLFVKSSVWFEKLAVMFNIGAISSELAGHQMLSHDEGLKQAMTMYQYAAGCFSFVSDNLTKLPDSGVTPDFWPETLKALQAVMLAQAQEIFYLKAINDNFKEGLVTKIGAQCADLYDAALALCQDPRFKVGDFSYFKQHWLDCISGKQVLYRALAEFTQAKQDYTDLNVGMAICRLQQVLKLFDGSAAVKHIKHKPMLDKLKQAREEAAKMLEKADKENKVVYIQKIPQVADLPPIEKMVFAKITQIQVPFTDKPTIFGQYVMAPAEGESLKGFITKKLISALNKI